MSQVPGWLQIVQSTATTVGVLLALYVAVWREPRKARDDRKNRAIQGDAERERHDAQIAALRQAEDERLAAQARRIVPAIFRGNVFSNTLWNVRIDNASTDTVSFIESTSSSVTVTPTKFPTAIASLSATLLPKP